MNVNLFRLLFFLNKMILQVDVFNMTMKFWIFQQVNYTFAMIKYGVVL
jgi:hypothetical protein